MEIHQSSSNIIMPNMAETDIWFHNGGIEIYHMRVHEHCLSSTPTPSLGTRVLLILCPLSL